MFNDESALRINLNEFCQEYREVNDLITMYYSRYSTYTPQHGEDFYLSVK